MRLYEPLIAGSVPVYLGAPNVENFLPTGRSVIKASDFPSIAALARYLHCLLDHPEHLSEYLNWRTRKPFASWKHWSQAYSPMCTACVRIRQRRFNDPATPNSSLPRFVPYVIRPCPAPAVDVHSCAVALCPISFVEEMKHVQS
ncbi:Glycoprotein 3-alpha-L-fucosyltransferase A [Diplonema papillatum]|nr:Glycoprotein 3-alpha-L-fucosyltransferase A [Diplonema papillatum]